MALLLRAYAFGDPVFQLDENWYLMVGERLAAGDQLYGEIWDRKPPLLFLIYWLAALTPSPVLAYQLLACVAAAATAFIILRMARAISTPAAAIVAALFYLALLVQMGGAGGQSPVFYNALIALAAWQVGFGKREGGQITLRDYGAMFAAGLAIMIKPTAGFEAIFLGLWLVWGMVRAGTPIMLLLRRGAVLALVGAAPALMIMAGFWLMGTFETFWQATVLSNFAKEAQNTDPLRWRRFALIWVVLAFPLGMAVLGLVMGNTGAIREKRAFLACWMVAALVGLFSVLNFYEHYLLPLLVPFSVAASAFFGRSALICALGAAGAMVSLLEERPWDFSRTEQHRREYAQLLQDVTAHHPEGGLLVYDGPPSLYADAGVKPLSPLSFPNHLWDRFESNVSGMDTAEEMRQMLAAKPTVVVMGREVSEQATNFETRRLIEAYLQGCEVVGTGTITGWMPTEVLDVYSNCGTGR